MLSLPRGVREPVELIKRLNSLAPFPPGVANLRYTIEDDWNGEPALFFWITLTDEAANPKVLPQTSRDIRSFVVQRVDPLGQWELFPYFSFRSQSEQAMLKGEAFG